MTHTFGNTSVVEAKSYISQAHSHFLVLTLILYSLIFIELKLNQDCNMAIWCVCVFCDKHLLQTFVCIEMEYFCNH